MSRTDAPLFRRVCRATLLIGALVLLGAGAAMGQGILLPAKKPATAESPVAQAIERHLQGLDSGLIVNAATRRVAGLQTFYSDRDFRPVWVVDGALTETATRLRARLSEAAREGLDPDDYDAGEFSPNDTYSTARYDIAQSAAALRYVNDLRNGRAAPSEIDPELFVEPGSLDAVATLVALAGSDDIAATLAGYTPQNPQYHRLRDALAALRAREKSERWDTLAAAGKLERGSAGPAVVALRARMRQDDPTLAPGTEIFDAALHDAVVAFQRRNGLADDGIVGKATVAALNVALAERVRQTIANMERWRWLPDDLGNRHIIVNIAGFELDAVVDGIVSQHMKVVVGKTYRRTPVFSAPMTYLEISPFWHVPPSIATQDLLPKIRKSVDFLAADGFRVFDSWRADALELDPAAIDWSKVGAKRFPYKLRQDPGPKNALGQIKFMMPNSYDIYLHDTAARSLFGKTVRVFSSGCIRVERPRDLALFVLDGQKDWTPEALAEAFAAQKTRKIVLRNPLPVHLTYQTAWVDDAGVLQFRDDIYERDAALSAILEAPRRANGTLAVR
jgi:L,D-transpeptidase YcbB